MVDLSRWHTKGSVTLSEENWAAVRAEIERLRENGILAAGCQHTDIGCCHKCQREATELHVYLDEQGIGDGTGTLLDRVVQMEHIHHAQLQDIRQTLGRGRTVGRDWQKAALAAENMIISMLEA